MQYDRASCIAIIVDVHDITFPKQNNQHTNNDNVSFAVQKQREKRAKGKCMLRV